MDGNRSLCMGPANAGASIRGRGRIRSDHSELDRWRRKGGHELLPARPLTAAELRRINAVGGQPTTDQSARSTRSTTHFWNSVRPPRPEFLSSYSGAAEPMRRVTLRLQRSDRSDSRLGWRCELVLECVAHRLGARPDPQLDEDIVHVLVRGARRDAYLPRDRPVCEPAGDEQ